MFIFPQVERPHVPEVSLSTTTVLPDYQSIGQFYESVREGRVAPDCITLSPLLTIGLRTFIGIEALCPEGSSSPCDLFQYNHEKEFGDQEIFYDSGMVVVNDKASALAALEKIVVQGEGASPDDPNSHYNIFKRLHEEYETWTCHDYLEDPTTAKYESTPLVHKVRPTTYYMASVFILADSSLSPSTLCIATCFRLSIGPGIRAGMTHQQPASTSSPT